VDNFNKELELFLENFGEEYNSITMRKRILYPKKLKGLLSKEFLECFRKERKRLVEQHGLNPKNVNQGIAKALLFFHSRF
jgi:hypothetical protein